VRLLTTGYVARIFYLHWQLQENHSLETVVMKRIRLPYLVLALCALFVLPSWGGDGRGGTAQTGTLSVGLTDASTDDYKAVYVTIGQVQLQVSADAWKVVASPNKTYNLLDLANGVQALLGIAELDAGDYTQMRLIIGDTPDDGQNILNGKHPYANYVIDLNDNEHELKIPSGFQAGVIVDQGFRINANQTTELILDFSASASVVVADNSGKWLLKPTIKVLNTMDYSIISGSVDDAAGNPLPGVLVSAQIYTVYPTPAPQGVDPIKDAVVVESSTVTDDEGKYKIFINPGTYNIVAYRTAYLPGVQCSVQLGSGEEENFDFTLTQKSSETFTTNVFITTDPEDDQYETLSFRQTAPYDGGPIHDIKIEVESVNLKDGSYHLVLPEGQYEVVVSSYEVPTEVEELKIDFGVTDTVLDIKM
jgi:hypothetical protein